MGALDDDLPLPTSVPRYIKLINFYRFLCNQKLVHIFSQSLEKIFLTFISSFTKLIKTMLLLVKNYSK